MPSLTSLAAERKSWFPPLERQSYFREIAGVIHNAKYVVWANNSNKCSISYKCIEYKKE
jgi:hypothetical protein